VAGVSLGAAEEVAQAGVLGLQFAQRARLDLADALAGDADLGADLLERVDRAVPDAFVIDIGLPDSDGRDLCQALRAKGVQAPVLFLTARDALVDRLAGFDAGGDDYLAKPFALAELVARLQALLRRSGSEAAVEAAGLRLDAVTHAVGDGSGTVTLTPTEFRLLAVLAQQAGRVVDPRALLSAVHQHDYSERDAQNLVKVHIANLRRKLNDSRSNNPYILCVRGFGYMLERRGRTRQDDPLAVLIEQE